MRSLDTTRLFYVFAIFLSEAAFSQQADIVEKPDLLWKFETRHPFLASPAIYEGDVYVGGTDSTLYALDLATGKIKWTFKTQGAIRSKVLIDGETLYLNGGDGNLYALERKKGKQRWVHRGGQEKVYDFADYHHANPVMHGGKIFYGIGSGDLFCIDASNGKPLWKFSAGDAIHTTVALAGERVFFGSFDGHVYCVDIATGKQHWKFKTVGHRFFPTGEVQGSPAVFNGLVLIGARDFNVYAIDQGKGYCHWNRSLVRGWGLVNTIADSVLHIGTGDERMFFSVDPLTGKDYWSKKMELLVFGSNAYTPGMLYVGTTIGKLHGLDRKTGTTVWSFETDGYKANRLKYFKADDSYRDDIYSIIKSNEHFLEVEFELGGIFSTPAISNDYLVFSSGEGAIYCLKAKHH